MTTEPSNVAAPLIARLERLYGVLSERDDGIDWCPTVYHAVQTIERHEREIERLRAIIDEQGGRIGTLLAQVENVADLHYSTGDDEGFCAHDFEDWPCPTFRDLACTQDEVGT